MNIDTNTLLSHLLNNHKINAPTTPTTRTNSVNPFNNSTKISAINYVENIQRNKASISQSDTTETSINTNLTSGRIIQDTVELESISFSKAQANYLAAGRNSFTISHKLASLTAGRVDRPISFAPAPSTTTSTGNYLHRAYFKSNADHASLNAAAVQRQVEIDTQA